MTHTAVPWIGCSAALITTMCTVWWLCIFCLLSTLVVRNTKTGAHSQRHEVAERRLLHDKAWRKLSSALCQNDKRRGWSGMGCGATIHVLRFSGWRQRHSTTADDKNKQGSDYIDGNCATQNNALGNDVESSDLCTSLKKTFRTLTRSVHSVDRGRQNNLKFLDCQLEGDLCTIH